MGSSFSNSLRNSHAAILALYAEGDNKSHVSGLE